MGGLLKASQQNHCKCWYELVEDDCVGGIRFRQAQPDMLLFLQWPLVSGKYSPVIIYLPEVVI